MHQLNKKQTYILDQLTAFLSYMPSGLRSANLDANTVHLLFEKIRSHEDEESLVIDEVFDRGERNTLMKIIEHFLKKEEQGDYQAVTGGTFDELVEIRNLLNEATKS